ncbi:polyphosphate:AMP phosphotransferase [Methanospirillum sp. J.3.6.1-F.2.7.3]|uniref:Polyphosphate:AMP phosphotransferase n=1 Tax=Methanospirillum purgamenti TaxID=2834276 RepID=A0A8E7AZ54_9EURY|nr:MULTISPECIES: polyphosphate:AMP phosphotransferase [Methanospirillum]MDX8549966.1 polyphosphate:AMP phosphotransferase [Methanospirillum hungatei]QVV90095.1 polyphosphate:AMP phosphotransferase [Methanospirillum sp. J.3.6.1-F.2.7.3]
MTTTPALLKIFKPCNTLMRDNMLEAFDLTGRVPKGQYSSIVEPLEARTAELQREVRKRGKSVIIVMEGWRGSGITRIINLLQPVLDPRGTRVHPIAEPNDIERDHGMFWRFWARLPSYGQTAIFDRSWYTATIVERYNGDSMKEIPASCIEDINNFEAQLISDGNLILKFFLHISKEEQKKRLNDIKDSPFTMQARYLHRKEGIYMVNRDFEMIDHMLMKTDMPSSPWTIIEAESMKYGYVRILQTFNSAVECWLEKGDGGQKEQNQTFLLKSVEESEESSLLQKADLTKSYTRAEYKPILQGIQESLRDLQVEVYKQNIPVVIVFEGWDAAGKGGCIIRLAESFNPRGYVVEPIGVPNDWEKMHHYLWRFYTRFPRKGHITIFDRSWYGRVLVERVEGFCSEAEWQRAYHEINVMEDELIRDGTVLIKFWLHIDKDEQLRRFNDRQSNIEKNWKITDEDWRNREKWDQYESAVSAMIRRTTTSRAPWTVIPANSKYYGRIAVLETVESALQKKIKEIK